MLRIRILLFRIISILWKRVPHDENKLTKRIEILYFIKTGRRFRMASPRTYTEKIQAYKVFLHNKNYERYTDKILVREWIKDVIGEEYLIPVIGVWNRADEIPFNRLQTPCVLKTNHGAGMNLIVDEVNQLDHENVIKRINGWLKKDYSIQNGFELQYENIIPKIYAEKKLVDDSHGLQEYKFFCFSGKPYFCMVDFDRFGAHKRNIYDMKWKLQDWNIGSYNNEDSSIPMPSGFDKMIEIARTLSSSFSHVRVDLYYVKDKIYFSELTFTTGSGYSFPYPESANLMLGELWDMEGMK